MSLGSKQEMIQHACARSIVRLDDGQVALLVSWGSNRGANRAIVEFQDRRRRTIRKDQVVTVEHDRRPAKDAERATIKEPTNHEGASNG